MKRLLIALAAFVLLALPASAQVFPGKYNTTPPTLVDTQGSSPLLDINSRLVVTDVCNTSAVINVAAAATQEIVALTAAQTIYVCSFVISGDTLATTALFKYGTGTTCGTGGTNLTGAMRMPDEGSIVVTSNGPVLQTIAANAFCITAATGAVTGFIEYIKY